MLIALATVVIVSSVLWSAARGQAMTWIEHTESDEGSWISVASSADGTKLVAANAGFDFGYLYTSRDAGVTWKSTGTTQNWRAVASSSDMTKLVAVQSYGFWQDSEPFIGRLEP